MPIPFECETHPAEDGPLLDLRIDMDIAALHSLVANLGAEPNRGADTAPPNGLGARAMDSKVLGSATVNEVIYRVLRGKQGRVLY